MQTLQYILSNGFWLYDKCVHAWLCLTLGSSVDCSPPGSSLCPWDSSGRNTGVGCHFLPQGIFLTQGLNLGFLHCKWMLLPTEPPGKWLHSVGCHFVLSMVSFAMRKLVSLVRSHLIIFAFISLAVGDWSKKQCYDLCQRMFCLCFILGV